MGKYSIEKIQAIIESGEPICILRARDNAAIHALERYLQWYGLNIAGPHVETHPDPFMQDFKKNVLGRFVDWRAANPEQCKIPD